MSGNVSSFLFGQERIYQIRKVFQLTFLYEKCANRFYHVEILMSFIQLLTLLDLKHFLIWADCNKYQIPYICFHLISTTCAISQATKDRLIVKWWNYIKCLFCVGDFYFNRSDSTVFSLFGVNHQKELLIRFKTHMIKIRLNQTKDKFYPFKHSKKTKSIDLSVWVWNVRACFHYIHEHLGMWYKPWA